MINDDLKTLSKEDYKQLTTLAQTFMGVASATRDMDANSLADFIGFILRILNENTYENKTKEK